MALGGTRDHKRPVATLGEETMKGSEWTLEILEQNAKWWEKAAVHCETLVEHACSAPL
jgi:hypothetical protein